MSNYRLIFSELKKLLDAGVEVFFFPQSGDKEQIIMVDDEHITTTHGKYHLGNATRLVQYEEFWGLFLERDK